MRHIEQHRTAHLGWLRAAVLGANDGLISTASLVIGVAVSGFPRSAVLIAGVAGLVAGAMSMAPGEYVSVSSQADTEGVDLARERRELASDDVAEGAELAASYVDRGLTPVLAAQVAEQLMAKVGVAGSNPVSRSIRRFQGLRLFAVTPLIFRQTMTVEVDRSGEIAYYPKKGAVPKWLRGRSAKPLLGGSNPPRASM